MKKGSELVWSICEWVSRIERTRTWLSIDRACDSDPASSAMVPLTSRQVMRQSRLSPPYPPRTWISIYRRDCISARPETKRGAACRAPAPLRKSTGGSEPGSDPERGLEAAARLLEVPPAGEVPVEVEADEVEGEAPAVVGDGVLQPLGVAVVEAETLERVEPGAPDIEE